MALIMYQGELMHLRPYSMRLIFQSLILYVRPLASMNQVSKNQHNINCVPLLKQVYENIDSELQSGKLIRRVWVQHTYQ